MSRRRFGFTLIELLVVIAIIAILAAILFPVFARARAKALQNNCLSNVKQLTLGMLMYADDFDQMLPTVGSGSAADPSWKAKLYPYVKSRNLYECPARHNDKEVSNEKIPGSNTGVWALDRFPRAYGINNGNAGGGTAPTASQGLPGIPKPAETILLMETWTEWAPNLAANNLPSTCYMIATPHSGVSDYAFCDGHAKAMKPTATILDQNMWSIEDDTLVSKPNALLVSYMNGAEQCGDYDISQW